MCLNPKKIINRTSHWHDGKPVYLIVPCGHCEECLQKQRNDWYVRCYYQWLQNRCSSFFYTLTYNNDNLPHYQGVSCFSKRHIQLFLKRLRHLLVNFDEELELKYMITCEFGEQCHRPHYHALFYLNKPVLAIHLYKMIEQAWQYGFVKYGDNLGIVSSYRGIRYVTKYITKDMAFFSDEKQLLFDKIRQRYAALLNYMKQRWHNCSSSLQLFVNEFGRFSLVVRKDGIYKKVKTDSFDYAAYKCFLAKVNRITSQIIPFHMQSSKLGLGSLNANSYEVLNQVCSIVEGDGVVKHYSLPRYYRKMFYYDLVESETTGKKTNYVLNTRGKELYLSNLDQRISNCEKSYKDVINNAHLINKDTLLLLNEVLYNSHMTEFMSIESLVHFCKNVDCNLHELSIYWTCFRNRYMPPMFLTETFTSDLLIDNYMDYVAWCISDTQNIDCGKIYEKFGELPAIQAFNLICWEQHPYFQRYEYVCTVLDVVCISLRQMKSRATVEQEKNARVLRDIVNNSINF